MTRTTAIWCVATDVLECTLLFATRTSLGRGRCLDGIAASSAFPERVHVWSLSCVLLFRHDLSPHSCVNYLHLPVISGGDVLAWLLQLLEFIVPGASVTKKFGVIADLQM